MARIEKLCSTPEYTKYFKDIQRLGKFDLFKRFDDIENVVNKKIDEKYRHFLATPIVEGDSITWFSKPYSETPQRLSELQGEERQQYEQIKNETLKHYKSKVDSLRNEGKSSEAEALANATKFVNDAFVYCFDGKTVLGVWGMQLKDKVREPLGIAMKNIYTKKKRPQPQPESPVVDELQSVSESPPEPLVYPFTIRFHAGEGGVLNGKTELSKYTNETITEGEIPKIQTMEGYEFDGWDRDPNDYSVTGDTEFTAQYRQIPYPVPPLPWYKRFWNGLIALFTGKGCLKWLLWLLLLLLLLLLFWWLFRSCSGGTGGAVPIPYPIEDKPWIHDDPRSGGDGIYNPGDPYTPTPTPPEYRDVLPPNQGVLPPLNDPEIIREPGMPVIIGNRLNILMENVNKSIMDLAKDFKEKYPEDKYKVVYYDDVVKRMQIEVPSAERTLLKQEIPDKFAPEYKLFVFDEALFEGVYFPDDPAFNDQDKAWYLHAVNAPQAWDITRGSPKLTVAIVDNGFNLQHPELKDKVVMPYNVWLQSNQIFPLQSDHGTHIAGTALAIADNAKGLCGIAPHCAFMPVQVANAQGFMTTTSILDGILYALYQGADVVNVSLGTDFTGLDAFSEAYQREMILNRFKEEERLWNKISEIADKHQATIVVAAGNDNVLAGIEPLQRPKNIVTVSAVNKQNQPYSKADFSNYGEYATISAPGVDIYSCAGSNNYAVMSGTSMAAPIVAGGIALMKSLNENLTAEQIICILQQTGLPTDDDIGKLIQLDKALEMVQSGEDCEIAEPPVPSTGDVQILLSWNNYNDLDIHCTDPSGATVSYQNTVVPSGGRLEIDMNVDYPDSKNPVEHIYWPTGGAPNGTYHVYLVYYEMHEPDINETPYTVTVKYGDKTEEYEGIITKEDSMLHICSFTLGTANNPQNPNAPNHPSTLSPNNRRDDLLQERERLQRELNRIERELQGL